MKLTKSIFLFLSCFFLVSSNFSYALEEEKTFLPGKRPQPFSYKESDNSDTHDDEEDKAVKKVKVASLENVPSYEMARKELCDAISKSDNETFRFLLTNLSIEGERRFNVGQEDFFFDTTEYNPMICAVRCHNHEALKTLGEFQENLNNKIDEDEKNDHKIIVEHLTPLHLAAKIGNWDAVRFLVEKIQEDDINPLDIKFSDSWEYTPHFEVFLTFLDFAFVYSELEDIRWLIEASLEHDFLFESIYNQSLFSEPNLDNLYYLIGRYSEHEEINKARILAAIICPENNKIITEYILENSDVKIDDEDGVDGPSLLHEVTNLRNHKVVSTLLKRGADVDGKNKDGMTPLHIISRKYNDSSHLSIFETLINNGANVNAVSHSKMTPLHYLARHYGWNGQSREPIKLLLSRGAGINTQDNEGNTPLHLLMGNYIAGFLETRFIKNFVEAGVDVNIQNKKSESVAFEALVGIARHKNLQKSALDLVKYIFENCNVDLEAKNIHGDTVIEVLEDLAKEGRFYTDKIEGYTSPDPVNRTRTEGRNFISLDNSEIQKELDKIYSTPRTKGIVTIKE